MGIEVWRASSAVASSSLKRIGSSSQATSNGFSASAMRSAGGSVHRPCSSTMISMALPTASRILANGSSALSMSALLIARAHRRLGGDVEGPDLHAADPFGEQALRQLVGVEAPGEQVLVWPLGGIARLQNSSPRCARTARCAWSPGYGRSRRRCCRSARSRGCARREAATPARRAPVRRCPRARC